MLKLNDLSFFYGALLRSILFIIIFFYILFPVCYVLPNKTRRELLCSMTIAYSFFIVLQYSVLRT